MKYEDKNCQVWLVVQKYTAMTTALTELSINNYTLSTQYYSTVIVIYFYLTNK